MDDDEARTLLRAERDRLTELLGEATDDVDAQQRERDAGDADAAKRIVDRELQRSELRQIRGQLEQVDAALRRVDEGTYGVSEVSGHPIPDERLRAQPTATRLVDEQQLADQLGRANDVTNPDLNRTV